MRRTEADADEVSRMDREGVDFDLNLSGPWRWGFGDFGNFQHVRGVTGGGVGDSPYHRWSHP
jgi:hypothetical protein